MKKSEGFVRRLLAAGLSLSLIVGGTGPVINARAEEVDLVSEEEAELQPEADTEDSVNEEETEKQPEDQSNNPVDTVSTQVAVKSVALVKSKISIGKGGTYQLTATLSPENATNKEVTWSSSDEKIATVSAEGLVTAKKKGSCVITVTTKDGALTATIKDVTWKSSNKKVATVDADGTVTAIKKGTATITVKTKDGKYTATCKIKVK